MFLKKSNSYIFEPYDAQSNISNLIHEIFLNIYHVNLFCILLGGGVGGGSGVFFTPFTYMPLYHYSGNLIGHFKIPHGLFSSEYFRKIELTIFLREAGIDRDSSPSSLLIRCNNHPFWRATLNIKENGDHHHFFIQIPILYLATSLDKTNALFVTVELIWLLFLNTLSFNFVATLNKSLRFKRFRRNYVNHPPVVPTNHCQSCTVFCLMCAG